MYIQQQPLRPGTVVKYRSPRYFNFVDHWGVIDYPDSLGRIRVTHCDKGTVVATTMTAEFNPTGVQLEIVRVPQSDLEGCQILQRIHTLDGKPYDLFVSNCEHVVNWAVTGVSFSGQLRFAALIVGLGVAAIALAKTAQA